MTKSELDIIIQANAAALFLEAKPLLTSLSTGSVSPIGILLDEDAHPIDYMTYSLSCFNSLIWFDAFASDFGATCYLLLGGEFALFIKFAFFGLNRQLLLENKHTQQILTSLQKWTKIAYENRQRQGIKIAHEIIRGVGWRYDYR